MLDGLRQHRRTPIQAVILGAGDDPEIAALEGLGDLRPAADRMPCLWQPVAGGGQAGLQLAERERGGAHVVADQIEALVRIGTIGRDVAHRKDHRGCWDGSLRGGHGLDTPGELR